MGSSGTTVGGMCEIDGMLGQLETDVDCGGPDCPPCFIGKACDAASDCTSKFCHPLGVCSEPACDDGLYDPQTELGPDCGLMCVGLCVLGDPCMSDEDCVGSAVCGMTNVCVVDPLCGNFMFDPGEVDLDCGGVCGPSCKVGDLCKVDGDCISNSCPGAEVCNAPPHCSDGKANFKETDIDCGGTCSKCLQGQQCAQMEDCWQGCDTNTHTCF